jgi:hypothetical protein
MIDSAVPFQYLMRQGGEEREKRRGRRGREERRERSRGERERGEWREERERVGEERIPMESKGINVISASCSQKRVHPFEG